MLFKKDDYQLSKLLLDIEQGEIGLPDIQRPFVWDATKVRDLFDSMYRGFPVGYLLFWANFQFTKRHKEGSLGKQDNAPRLLIVDGQQRLTSLYAVMTRKPVITKDFKERYITLAFSPLDGRFEVADAATDRNPEFIPDISQLWSPDAGLLATISEYLNRLQKAREVTLAPEEKKSIEDSITGLLNLQYYPFTAMEVASTVDEEQVAEIFVRINSKGVILNQADFILTLLSVYWDEGRKELEAFCANCRQPPLPGRPSPFNYFIQPHPSQMLRSSVGFGFKRATLKHVYSLLRGKDLETGQFSDERREEQFQVLKSAQQKTLDLINWQEFIVTLQQAGFTGSNMITSDLALLYAYTMFLIGKYGFGIEHFALRNLIARWFFLTALTSRYSASPESQMESDLARLRQLNTGAQFTEALEQQMRATLTEDFWNITLVNDLNTSSARSPVLFAYVAALNLLDAKVLFSQSRVSQMINPALISKKSALERHHLFPKAYLSKIGYNTTYQTNQIANYALVEWQDNIPIADQPPSDYFPHYAQRFSADELSQMMEWHALPAGWEHMEYEDFLAKRRELIAGIIRQGFEQLTSQSHF